MKFSVKAFSGTPGVARCLCGILYAGLMCAAQSLHAEVPDALLDYVEATGDQFVDLGVEARSGTKVEAQLEWTSLSYESCFLGADATNGASSVCFLACGSDEKIAAACGAALTLQTTNPWDKPKWRTGRVYDMAADFAVATNTADGATIWTQTIDVANYNVHASTSAVSVATGQNLYLFARHAGDGTFVCPANVRCYGLKIWQNAGTNTYSAYTLVRNLQPCTKNGRVGLYDAVSGEIFYSGSAVDLVAGSNVVQTDFIDVPKGVWFDVGVKARSGTRMWADMEWAAVGEGDEYDRAFLGARKDGNTDSRVFLFHTAHGRAGLGYGSYKDTGHGLKAYRRYEVETELRAGSQTMKIDGKEVFSEQSDLTIDTGLNFYLFANNIAGSAKFTGAGRIYGLKIWQTGDDGEERLVRNFSPCRWQGRVALIDDVSYTIFHPNGVALPSEEDVSFADGEPDYFCEYVSGGGAHHVDTGVRAKSGLRAVGTFRDDFTEPNTEQFVYLDPAMNERTMLAACDAVSSNRFYMMHCAQGLWMGYGSSGGYPEFLTTNATTGAVNTNRYTGWTIGITEKHTFEASFAVGLQTLKLDGKEIMCTTKTNDVDAGCNLHVFACRKGDQIIYPSRARCYGLKIWQMDTNGTETCVRDFRPCVKDGKIGLYDAIENRVHYVVPNRPVEDVGALFLTSDQKAKLANAKPVEYLAWVEADGTQFVDTGVAGCFDTTAEMEMAWMSDKDEDDEFLGARTGNERFYMWHNAHCRASYGYGDFMYLKSGDPANVFGGKEDAKTDGIELTAGRKYKVRTMLNKSSQQIVVDGDTWHEKNESKEINTDRTLYLFGCNQDGTAMWLTPARCHALTLWQDGLCVRQFRPVRLDNGFVALWDTCFRKVYLPQNGSGIVPPDFLQNENGVVLPLLRGGPVVRRLERGLTLILR